MSSLKERIGKCALEELKYMVREKFSPRGNLQRTYPNGSIDFFKENRGFYEELASFVDERLGRNFLNLVDPGLYRKIIRDDKLEELPLGSYEGTGSWYSMDKEEIRDVFKEELTVRGTAESLGVSTDFVRKNLEKSPEELKGQEIVKEYQRTGMVGETAKNLGLSRPTVSKYLKLNGVEIKRGE